MLKSFLMVSLSFIPIYGGYLYFEGKLIDFKFTEDVSSALGPYLSVGQMQNKIEEYARSHAIEVHRVDVTLSTPVEGGKLGAITFRRQIATAEVAYRYDNGWWAFESNIRRQRAFNFDGLLPEPTSED